MTSFILDNLEPAAAPPFVAVLAPRVAEVERACRDAGVAPRAVSASATGVTASIDEGEQAGELVLYRLGVEVWRVNRTPTLTSVIGERGGVRFIVYTARGE